jgi:hypothetical protein
LTKTKECVILKLERARKLPKKEEENEKLGG